MAAAESVVATVWEPAQIFAEDDAMHKRIHASFGIVVLNQPMTLVSDVYRRVWQNGIFQIAADGGANRLLDLNHYPDKLCLAHRLEFSKNYSGTKLSKEQPILDLDVIIGDLDSLSDDATEFWKSKHAQIVFVDDQDSTDFTKAVNYIRDWTEEKEESFMKGRRLKASQVTDNKSLLPPKDIVCIGGIAGRIDQGISQLHHLYMFQNDSSYKAGRMLLLSSEAITFVLKTGNHKIRVQDPWLGKHIGIIPLKEPSRITTSGLVWDVEDWPTSFGTQMSTSNAPKEDSEWVNISTTKDVLFTIDLASPPVSPRCTLGETCQFDEYENLVKTGDYQSSR